MRSTVSHLLGFSLVLSGACDAVRPQELWNTSLTSLLTSITSEVSEDISEDHFPDSSPPPSTSNSPFSAGSLPSANLVAPASGEIDLSAGSETSFVVRIRLGRAIVGLDEDPALTLVFECAGNGDPVLEPVFPALEDGLAVAGVLSRAELTRLFDTGNNATPTCEPSEDGSGDQAAELNIRLTIRVKTDEDDEDDGSVSEITVPVNGTLTIRS